jgi:hypothetical protein
LVELGKNHVEREWDWWEDGRREREHERQWAILSEWNNGAPKPRMGKGRDTVQAYLHDVDRDIEAEAQRRVDVAAEHYDEERAHMRLDMLRAEADTAFFGHVLQASASAAQRDKAEQRMTERQEAAQRLRAELGDPEQVIDKRGYLPTERRAMHLSEHVTFWRHPLLRELHSSRQRKRFNALLGIRPPAVEAMCSECQAPSQWHEYALSLCLFRGSPEPGSQAATLAALLPGWWSRCVACTNYQLEHQWGGHRALADFDGAQWQAMLPHTLREIFAPDPPKPRRPVARPAPLAVITAGSIDDVLARLAEAKTKFPNATVRSGPRGTWEIWPDS